MSINPEIIEEYFKRYEWSYNRTSDNTWVTGVRTTVSSFRIFIRLTEHWVYFVINPYVVTPIDLDTRLRFYYHVLRLNLDMNMAKFGLDSDGDLFLAIELPTENFQYSHFADALNGLSHHAERLYSEVFNLAHNPEVVVGRFDEELPEEFFEEYLEEFEDDEIEAEIEPNPRHFEDSETEIENEMRRPLDDIDLPEESESSDDRAIIAGREVKIIDDENGMRIEFETMHDMDEETPQAAQPTIQDEPPTESESSEDGDSSQQQDDNNVDDEKPEQD
jgi:hypothetical protein